MAPYSLAGVFSSIQEGAQNGGTWGAVGAGLTAVGKMVPGPIGMVMQAAGGIISMVTDFMTRAARKMGETIAKSVDNIMQKYQHGNITLVSALDRITLQYQRAIVALSGMKGGGKVLAQLLPQIQQSIEELIAQQKQIISNFLQQLNTLRMSNQVLGEAYSKFSQINKDVAEFLGAGGDTHAAQEYISLALQQERLDLIGQQRENERQAVEDAIQLNELLKQRNQLEDDYNKSVFAAATQGSLEKRGAAAILAGQDLAKTKKDYQDQLSSLNSQIDLQLRKVDKEKEVFQIASDINDLHRQDAELQLAALDDEITKYKSIWTLINGIQWNASTKMWTIDKSLLSGMNLTNTEPLTEWEKKSYQITPKDKERLLQIFEASLSGQGWSPQMSNEALALWQKYGIPYPTGAIQIIDYWLKPQNPLDLFSNLGTNTSAAGSGLGFTGPASTLDLSAIAAAMTQVADAITQRTVSTTTNNNTTVNVGGITIAVEGTTGMTASDVSDSLVAKLDAYFNTLRLSGRTA